MTFRSGSFLGLLLFLMPNPTERISIQMKLLNTIAVSASLAILMPCALAVDDIVRFSCPEISNHPRSSEWATVRCSRGERL